MKKFSDFQNAADKPNTPADVIAVLDSAIVNARETDVPVSEHDAIALASIMFVPLFQESAIAQRWFRKHGYVW